MITIQKSTMTKMKVRQFRNIGMTSFELDKITDILDSAITATTSKLEVEKSNFGCSVNMPNLFLPHSSVGLTPCAVTYNIRTGDIYQYNIGSITNEAARGLDYKPVNHSYIMKNSYALVTPEVPETTNSTRKLTDNETADELKTSSSELNRANLGSRISQLQNLLEGISDESEVLITAKPKNRSYKIRKSNRYSRYRGVSLNGKKWQVMIMGPTKKKYFGAISSEREAAVLYDKLSILTNGLAAKTNFNYRKCDLVEMMPELEYMQPFVSN